MALNPVAYTENVVTSFLRYQLTAYPFADKELYRQMRELLSLSQSRNTPLLKGPYISLSRSFQAGAPLAQLVTEQLAHPLLAKLHDHPALYAHQERAYRSIARGKSTLVSTGTGSGKTEAFLYPIISRCLRLRDQNAAPGITAVIVYPMNALAEDQLGRLRDLLAGTGVTFGMYIGKTPAHKNEITNYVMQAGSSRADYRATLAKIQRDHPGTVVHPAEERTSREQMRTTGEQPRILLTNVKQLELLLTRQADVELFDSANLEFLVFDEAHTYRGAGGAETACLIRRLRAFCGKSEAETVCVATSATIADAAGGGEAARDFFSRFFGVDGGGVEIVGEEYAADVWAPHLIVPALPPGEPEVHLREVLQAVDVDDSNPQPVIDAYRNLTGRALPPNSAWRAALHQELISNRIVYELSDLLKRPQLVGELLSLVRIRVDRQVSEAELLIWLALGAAAQVESRPLLRPVVHGFVRGIGGAVVTFPVPTSGEKPTLYLSAEDAERERGNESIARLNVLSCTTCGQHYFEHSGEDFTFDENMHVPGGGAVHEDGRFWAPLAVSVGGKRLVLFDNLISQSDDDGADDDGPPKTAQVYLCRCCGALHDHRFTTCGSCGRDEPPVALFAVQQKAANPGCLTRCVSCGSLGRGLGSRFREPARPVRATTVSDVHVLAQDMIARAERPRLLVFADNRQDAAFQAGWMRDHARRFRLRSLMAQMIANKSCSVGDLTSSLDDLLELDDSQSRALLPEVWEVQPKEKTGIRHAEERKRFLRLQVLLELTMNSKQRQGLEPLGRLRVDYHGLRPDLPFIVTWASRLELSADRLCAGIAGILDRQRRSRLVYDAQSKLFTKLWQEGDQEIMRGYVPMLKGVPRGIKLQREDEKATRLSHWITKSSNTVRQIVKSWGVPANQINDFISDLWNLLVSDLQIIVPTKLTGPKGNPLPHCIGAHQIDASVLLISENKGLWRCGTCRRAQIRPMPHDRCPAWRCEGRLQFELEDPDNYDLQMLDDRVRMILPQEHSAQVPAERREQLELLFKSSGDGVNTLVATPTLELGVDIGALDAVLMRNVPPLPANYWQRAGRAGRRHRMAVNLTYVRPVTHDQAYFKDPTRILEGHVEPPRFNLRNSLMVAKHVHSAVITRLYSLSRAACGLSEQERIVIAQTLASVLPRQVKEYLFEQNGDLRGQLYDVSPLGSLIHNYRSDILAHVTAIFAQGWPTTDADVVNPGRLEAAVDGMADGLQVVVRTLVKRLNWALGQMDRLEGRRGRKGSLEPDEDALYDRCDRLVKRLKGMLRRGRRDAEGIDDTNTYGVLAAEGFLPGYGLEIGAIVGTALLPKSLMQQDFDLPRPPLLALREYVPGNMIYANGNRFAPRFYHLEAQEEALLFQVDVAAQAVTEVGAPQQDNKDAASLAGMADVLLPAVPICDVDMAHVSHISDDEDYRFQMGVSVFGHELGRHQGGDLYGWSGRSLLHRRGVHLRLVNVGPTTLTDHGDLGYPLCTVCGQSRSPFSSEAERDQFKKSHLERCGKEVKKTGYFADIVADTILLKDCSSREEAYSIMEALRTAASHVLEMELEDLQVLVIGQAGTQICDALLIDPMPGGSGLLDQMIARFDEVTAEALNITRTCPSACDRSCIDCLQTFRNSYFHKHLNRQLASELIEEWGNHAAKGHPIPPVMPKTDPTGEEMPVDRAESRLKEMLDAASFPRAEWHKQIQLGKPLGSTSPDCFWQPEPDEPGICLYLDGMSKHIHGNSATRERDVAIRTMLKSLYYDVFEITATELHDKEAMKRHFFRIAKALIGKEGAKTVKDDDGWFGG